MCILYDLTQVTTTDGDEAVIKLLSSNAQSNKLTKADDDGATNKIEVKQLLWGVKDPIDHLSLPSSPSLLMGTYAVDVCINA